MMHHSDKYIFSDYLESLSRINEAYFSIPEGLIEAVRINQQIVENLPYSFIETNALIQQFYNTYSETIAPYIEQIQPALAFYKSLPQNYIETINNIASITKPLTDALRSIDFSSVMSNATIEDDFVELDENDFETLSSFAEASGQEVLDSRASSKASASGKHRITLAEFISIMLTIFFGLAALIQNQYFHELDSIAAEKQQLEMSSLYEGLISELSELNKSFTHFFEYIESLPEDQKAALPNCDMPDLSPSEDQEAQSHTHEPQLYDCAPQDSVHAPQAGSPAIDLPAPEDFHIPDDTDATGTID